MASADTGTPPPAHPTTETSSVKWSLQVLAIVTVNNHVKVDVALRAFLFVTALVAVVVMVTSKETARIPVSPVMTISVDAKFTHSASFTYFVSALSVTCLYSIITGYSSFSTLKKLGRSSIEQQLHLVLLDTLMLGIVAAATGAAGGVAYEALKGNPHIRWMKICHIYNKFCGHLGGAITVSLISSLTLILLIYLSACMLAKNSGR